MRIRTTCGAVLASIAIAGVAHADWEDDYRDGVTAADAGRWQQVASTMRSAIAANPQASDRRMRIYGMRFEPYVPHFYLGQALAELGDCEGALASLETSLDSGVIQQTTRLADLRRIQERCRAALPTPTPTPPPVPTSTPTPAGPDPEEIAAARRDLEAALREAEALRQRYENLTAGREGASVVRQDPRLRTVAADAASALATAREASATEDPDALRARAEAARRASDAYGQATRRVEALLASAARSEVQPTRTPRPTPRPTATPRPTLVPRPAEQDVPRPPALDAAAAAWLEGRTAEVVTFLDEVPSSSDRATAVALLLRSAARWSLWREGGGRDAELRAAALEDALRCRETDPEVAPFADAFPPRFVVFFSSASR